MRINKSLSFSASKGMVYALLGFFVACTSTTVDEFRQGETGISEEEAVVVEGNNAVSDTSVTTDSNTVVMDLLPLDEGFDNFVNSFAELADGTSQSFIITGVKFSAGSANINKKSSTETLEKIVVRTPIEHVIMTSLGDRLGLVKGKIVNAVVKYVKKMVPTFNLPDAVRFNTVLAQGKNLELWDERAWQQENDEAIQNFTKVCNKYLADKEIIYDESNVTIDIVRKKNKRTVDIESLSSGEKQIISLFALLYLQKKENLAIFFDEPELSLSMEWQKTLLPDIVNSGKCKFLFSTTHSPFIFDNELEDHTVDLFEYIEEL